MKKKVIAVLLAASMVLSLAACGSSSSGTTDTDTSAADGETTVSETGVEGGFKLGFIGPLTGDVAIYGVAAQRGAQIAVDEINALGEDITFDFNAQDDVHDPETSVNAYNTLMDWGMQALVGPITTSPAISVSDETEKDNVFAVTPSASSVDVIDASDSMFQVCFTDPNQGVASADYISENLDTQAVAVIYNNADAYSSGIYETFASEAASVGLNLVYEGTFTDDTATDFSVQLQAAQAAGADLIFLPIYYTPASVIMTQADSMGYDVTFFGVDGMDGILTLEGFDTSLAEGVYLLTPFSADATDELTQSFVSKYEEAYGETPNQFAADGYDAVYIIYNCLKESGCTTDMSASDICDALVPAITSISIDGLTGAGMTWDESGAVSKDPMAVIIEDGEYKLP